MNLKIRTMKEAKKLRLEKVKEVEDKRKEYFKNNPLPEYKHPFYEKYK